ncbi:MAG TPA: NUDIX hydrolase [Prolixibacteraceae bacterium]|jgi:8-oxo-dGTP diphosphatase
MDAQELKYCYKYPRLAMTVDAIIVADNFSEIMVLLIQRKHGPFEGVWALPGGFVGMDETLKEACNRELFEETGLKDVELKQFYTFDAIGRDPRHRTVTTVFYGRIPEPADVTGGDDAAKADWFPIISLPPMAFDHAEIIHKFVKEQL